MKTLMLLASLLILAQCNFDKAETIETETIIIGAGLMGSTTAYHLSMSRESDLILLEKQDSIYTEGSSFGEARIARSSNRGSDIWSFLHNNSVSETENLVRFLNGKKDSGKYRMDERLSPNLS